MGITQRDVSAAEIVMDLREMFLKSEAHLRQGDPEAVTAAKLLHDTRLALAAIEYGEAKLETARRQGIDEGFGIGFKKGFDTGYDARRLQELAEANPESEGVVVPLRPAISA